MKAGARRERELGSQAEDVAGLRVFHPDPVALASEYQIVEPAVGAMPSDHPGRPLGELGFEPVDKLIVHGTTVRRWLGHFGQSGGDLAAELETSCLQVGL